MASSGAGRDDRIDAILDRKTLYIIILRTIANDDFRIILDYDQGPQFGFLTDVSFSGKLLDDLRPRVLIGGTEYGKNGIRGERDERQGT